MTTTQNTETLTDEQWEIAEAIDLVLDANPDRSYSRSEMARKVKSDLLQTGRVLAYMAATQNGAVASGNGAWTRYSARRA